MCFFNLINMFTVTYCSADINIDYLNVIGDSPTTYTTEYTTDDETAGAPDFPAGDRLFKQRENMHILIQYLINISLTPGFHLLENNFF